MTSNIMTLMASSRPGLIKRFVDDESGTASIEFTIVLAVMVMALVAAGMVVGPAVHGYATRLKAITLEARAALNELQAVTPPPEPQPAP